MKKLLFLVILLCIEKALTAQYVYTIKADSVKITNSCDTAELILENHTQNVPGFLFNKGRGRTEFRRAVKLNDSSLVLGGDTIVINTLAANGLSLNGKTVELGGNLTKNTTINQGANNLTFDITGQSNSLSIHSQRLAMGNSADMSFRADITASDITGIPQFNWKNYSTGTGFWTPHSFRISLNTTDKTGMELDNIFVGAVFSVNTPLIVNGVASRPQANSNPAKTFGRYNHFLAARPFNFFGATGNHFTSTAGLYIEDQKFGGIVDTAWGILVEGANDINFIGGNLMLGGGTVTGSGGNRKIIPPSNMGDLLQVHGNVLVTDSLKLIGLGDRTDTVTYKPMAVDASGNVFKMASWPTPLQEATIKRTGVNDAGYTAGTSDHLIAYTSLTAARTVTLPAASGMTNRVVIIKDESGAAATHNITVNVTAGGTIDGASSKAISTNYGIIEVYSNGSQWFTK